MTAYDRVFAAVFPPPAAISVPTPTATPVLGSSAFGESFGSVTDTGGATAQQFRWDRAWHVATLFLLLPEEPITLAVATQDEEALKAKWIKQYTPEARSAITYVVSEDSGKHQPFTQHGKDDLIRWYKEEVIVRHYLEHVKSGLERTLQHAQSSQALYNILRVLHVAQAIYLHPVRAFLTPQLPRSGKKRLADFEADLHGIFAYSLPRDVLASQVTRILSEEASIVLGLQNSRARAGCNEDEPQSLRIEEARRLVLEVVRRLNSVGLGGPQVQRIFAEVMFGLLRRHVKTTYAGKWSSPSTIVDQLKEWVEDTFSRLVVEVMQCFRVRPDESQLTDVSHSDVETWQKVAIGWLGALRTRELFDVIVDWESGSQGAIEDLKHYVTTTTARRQLTSSFAAAVTSRLLQPGASTLEIIQFYISIIRAFLMLDPKGVLLDQVARPIRRYLREREDTVPIVVGGLLADPEDDASTSEVLIELAQEMSKSASLVGKEDNETELDYDDMDWMPDPVDAGPEYKKSKYSDVIGSLISLFESKHIFVKEFQNILGERLLRREYDFDREIRVLELLKIRFGEPALQACEVMLRDILDSRRVDSVIRNDPSLQLQNESDRQSPPKIHARILSHLFWPPLHEETFFIPPQVANLQNAYSVRFQSLKHNRKLTWLHALGQVTVELDLEDRKIREEVQTWQASVIYAFQDPAETPVPLLPVSKTAIQLTEELEMPESLVTNALTFWVSKLVLHEVSPSTYEVLETLSPADLNKSDIAAAENAANASAAAPNAAIRSEEDLVREKLEVLWQFVVGMLTNQGSMKLEGIVMMLGMVVPGGIGVAVEELREFLDGRIKEGRLEVQGGSYKILN